MVSRFALPPLPDLAAKHVRYMFTLALAAFGAMLPAHAGSVPVSTGGTGNWSNTAIWPAVGGIGASYGFPGDTPSNIFNYPGFDVNITGSGDITLDQGLGSSNPVHLVIQPGGILTNTFNGPTSFYRQLDTTNQAITNSGTINVQVGNLGAFTIANDSSLWNSATGVIDLTGNGGLTFDDFIQNDGTLDLAGAGNTITGTSRSGWLNPLLQNFGIVKVELGSTLTLSNSAYTQVSGLTKVLGTLNSNEEIDIAGGVLGGGGTVNANVVVSGNGLIKPGDPQTLTFGGSFTLGTGDIYLDSLGPNPADQDHIVFNGVADLSGGTVQLDIPLNVNLNGLSLSLFSFNGGQAVGATLPTFSFVNGQNYQIAEKFVDGVGTIFQFSGNTVGGGVTTPEPATFGLFAGALALLAVSRRRKAA
jgi:hypothetical protein